ncbi:MAG: J domain-containing protein [Aquabacterium sp.]
MSKPERRNYYRLLHVQPEAPAEVIKASYRALMSTLRAHPDLGGDTDTAARLNAAYAVLSDPAQRATYDQSIKRQRHPAGAGAAGRPDFRPAAEVLDPGCPMCGRRLPRAIDASTRCSGCDSPLMPAPREEMTSPESLGRRRAARHAREQPALLRVAGEAQATSARLRDLSLNGLSLVATRPVPARTTIRVSTDFFDALAVVVQCRRVSDHSTVHARLLTLQLLRPKGVYVNARA